jgi:hypothetical protein
MTFNEINNALVQDMHMLDNAAHNKKSAHTKIPKAIFTIFQYELFKIYDIIIIYNL